MNYKGDLEKLLPDNFSRREAKMRFPLRFIFQLLSYLKHGGISLPRTGTLNFSRYPKAIHNLRALMFIGCISGYSMSAPALDNPDTPDYVSEFLSRAQVHESGIREIAHSTQGYLSTYATYEDFLHRELDTTYERLLGQLDKDARQALEDSQRKWLKYRDAEFEFIRLNWTPKSSGSSSVISRGDYRTKLIKDRITSLLNYLRNYLR